jgi:hypothetical protein
VGPRRGAPSHPVRNAYREMMGPVEAGTSPRCWAKPAMRTRRISRCGCEGDSAVLSRRAYRRAQAAAPMELGGYTIPAGTTVAPCVHLVHRRPDIYPEPLRFRARAFPRTPGRHLHMDSLRRRRAALSGGSLRADADEAGDRHRRCKGQSAGAQSAT